MRRKERRQKTKRKIKIKTLIHYYTCIGEHIETHSSFTYPATGYAPCMELDSYVYDETYTDVYLFFLYPHVLGPLAPFDASLRKFCVGTDAPEIFIFLSMPKRHPFLVALATTYAAVLPLPSCARLVISLT